MLTAAGFGPRGAELAGDLAAHVRAWSRAGRPDLDGLHVDAYPKYPGAGGVLGGFGSLGGSGSLGSEAMVAERPRTRFVVYRSQPGSAGVSA
jgi:hypothetical protein